MAVLSGYVSCTPLCSERSTQSRTGQPEVSQQARPSDFRADCIDQTEGDAACLGFCISPTSAAKVGCAGFLSLFALPSLHWVVSHSASQLVGCVHSGHPACCWGCGDKIMLALKRRPRDCKGLCWSWSSSISLSQAGKCPCQIIASLCHPGFLSELSSLQPRSR